MLGAAVIGTLSAALAISASTRRHDQEFDERRHYLLAYVSPDTSVKLVDSSWIQASEIDVRCGPPVWDKSNSVETLAWKDASSRLACITVDGGVAVAALDARELVTVLPASSCERRLMFSASGDRVACIGSDRLFIRTAGGGFESEVTGVFDYVWSSAGELLAIRRSDSGKSYILTPQARAVAEIPDAPPLTDLRWSSDGRRVAYGTLDGISFVDLSSGAATSVPAPWPSRVVGWTVDGLRLLVQPVDGADDVDGLWTLSLDGGPPAKVIDAKDIWSPLQSSGNPALVAFAAPDAEGRVDNVVLAEQTTGALAPIGSNPQPPRREGPTPLRFSPDGRVLCWLASMTEVRCFDAVAGAATSLTLRDETWQTPQQTLSRVSCTGTYSASIIAGPEGRLLEVSDGEKAVFQAPIQEGTEPVWRC